MGVRTQNFEAITRSLSRIAALRDGASKTLKRAAATLVRRLPAQAKRDITAQYNLPSRRVGSALRCTADESSVTLTAKGRAIGLTDFGAKQNAVGVDVSIERGHSTTIPHAFVATPQGAISATGAQVYVRGEAFNAAQASFPPGVADAGITERSTHGYPIVRIAGPSVADMLRDDGREDRLMEFARQNFADEVDRLIEVAANG